MKTTVIYHSADFDGIFCREIAKHFLPDANLIGWNFGDPLIPMPQDGDVYILDLSPDCLGQVKNGDPNRLIWIDHHKTSIDKWERHQLRGYRIDGVAACRLAWQWFLCCDGNWPAPRTSAMAPAGVLPQKQGFIRREVQEPPRCTAGG